jgi:hypothetical protein
MEVCILISVIRALNAKKERVAVLMIRMVVGEGVFDEYGL